MGIKGHGVSSGDSLPGNGSRTLQKAAALRGTQLPELEWHTDICDPDYYNFKGFYHQIKG